MTIYEYSTIYNMNRSLLKDNSNMKENEYDNGYIERQTVSSNPPELPQIRVSVFENYFAQPVELGADGLPAQSAHGGYDLKSLRSVAQQHDGSMTVHWENRWFTVRLLMPLPKEK